MTKRRLNNLKKMLLCCCLLVHIIPSYGQNLEWAKHIGGPEGDDGRSIAIDSEDNVYITGRFKQTVDFDPGVGVQTLTATGTNFNTYILKLDAAGDFLWVKQFEGSGNEPKALALDTSGNVYITGSLPRLNTIDLDPGPGVLNFSVTAGTAINMDVYVVKLNTSGTLIWAKQMGGISLDQSTNITVDNNGNVYTLGRFRGTADYNPGTAVNNLTAVNSTGDCFISKLDNDGNYVWAKSLGATSFMNPADVDVDENGNVYITGAFAGTADFDPGPGTANLTTVPGEFFPATNMFICKLNAEGNYIWAKNVGQSGSPTAANGTLALDQYGHLYLAGGFSDTVDFDPGTGTATLISALTGASDLDIFVSKLDTAGNYIWAKSIGSITIESGRPLLDNYGNLYLTGSFRGPVDMDPSTSATELITPSAPSGGTFIAKYDSSLSFSWVTYFDAVLGSNGFDAKLSKVDNSIHMTGDFYGTVDFDPGVNVTNFTSSGTSWGDAFVLKLKNCFPLTDTIITSACDSFTLNDNTYLVSGTFTQAFIAANGCDSTVVLELTINQRPGNAVTQTGSILSANTTAATYQWIDCNNGNALIPGATQQAYTVINSGSYAVIVTKNDCSDTSACYPVTVTGIQDKHPDNTISVYPNPVKQNLNISLTRPIHNAAIRISNIVGQILLLHTAVSGTTFEIDMASYPAGTYLLEIATDDGVLRSKIEKL